MEHGLARKQTTDRHAVETAGQPVAFVPRLDAVHPSQLVQTPVGAFDSRSIHAPGRRRSAQASITSSKAVFTRISNRLHAFRSDRVTRSPAPGSNGMIPRGSGDHQATSRRRAGIGKRPERYAASSVPAPGPRPFRLPHRARRSQPSQPDPWGRPTDWAAVPPRVWWGRLGPRPTRCSRRCRSPASVHRRSPWQSALPGGECGAVSARGGRQPGPGCPARRRPSTAPVGRRAGAAGPRQPPAHRRRPRARRPPPPPAPTPLRPPAGPEPAGPPAGPGPARPDNGPARIALAAQCQSTR